MVPSHSWSYVASAVMAYIFITSHESSGDASLQNEEEMKQWDEASVSAVPYGSSLDGLMGTSPLETVLDMYSGKSEAGEEEEDEQMNEEGQEDEEEDEEDEEDEEREAGRRQQQQRRQRHKPPSKPSDGRKKQNATEDDLADMADTLLLLSHDA